MNDNNIDNLFRRGLAGHRTPPPAHLWDQLEEQLGDEEEKKKGFLFWQYGVAAALVLLLVAGWLILDPGQSRTGQLADEDEEIQNLAHGEDEEIQNRVLDDEDEEIQNRDLFAVADEDEEIQNRMVDDEDEEIQNRALFAVADEDEEIQNRMMDDEDEEIQNLMAANEPMPTAEPLQVVAGIAPALHMASGPALLTTGIAPIALPTMAAGSQPFGTVSQEQLLNQAVALADDMKSGEFTLADLRDAKEELGYESGLSLAALRDAKNEFLSFAWVTDDD